MKIRQLNKLTLNFYIILSLTAALSGCQEDYTPKPYSYYRIDLPEKSYKESGLDLPYHFLMATDAVIEQDRDADAEPYWVNIYYPAYHAQLHISYKTLTADSSLAAFEQDCHHLAYTHTIKAESIKEQYFHKDKSTFGLVYFIEGNAASSTQFFITDSVKHFIRGALYFNERPNKDSLAPVINYLRKDIVMLMETIRFDKK